MGIMEEMMSKMDKAMSDSQQKSGKTFQWTEDALGRLERVPEGFMRKMTKSRIEQYAEKLGVEKITLAIAEDGMSGARNMMTSMMGSGAAQEEEQEVEEVEKQG